MVKCRQTSTPVLFGPSAAKGTIAMKLFRPISVLLVLLMLILPFSAAAEGEAEPAFPETEQLWTRETPLSESLALTETVFSNGSRQTEHILHLIPGGSVLPQLAFGSSLLEKLDFDQALESSSKRILAGINGDYFVMATGMPLGLIVQNGELLSSDDGNYAFGFREDGSAFLGKPALRLSVSTEDASMPISCFNKSFRTGAFCLYSSAWGESTPAVGETWNLVLAPKEQTVISVGGEASCTLESIYRSDGPTRIQSGRFVLCLTADSDDWRLSFLDSLERGMELTLHAEAGDEEFIACRTALGCLYRLVWDGEIEEGLEKLDKSRAPRTSIGIREDGSVLFYTVDGRQPGYSLGLTLEENAHRLLELGCVAAGTLDGGASTLLGAQLPGEDACSIVNEPSLGSVRKTPQFLLLTAPLEEAGELCTLAVFSEQRALLCGSSASFSVGGCDRNGAPVSADEPQWSADRGSFDPDGVYTAPLEAGEVVITAECCDVSGSLRIPVISDPDSMTIRREDTGREVSSLKLLPGEKAELTARAVWHTFQLQAEDELFQWSLEGETGSLEADGTFTAGDRAGNGVIVVSCGSLCREIQVQVTEPVICAEDYETYVSGSAEGLSWTQERQRDRARYGFGSLRLDYDLEQGSVLFPMEDVDTGLLDHVSFWVQSDGSGNRLYSVHEEAELLLCVMDRAGWVPIMVNTGRFGPVRGLRIAGEGKGTIRLDQIVLSVNEDMDTGAPVLRLSESDGQMTGEVWDLAEGVLPPELISLTVDGEEWPFDYRQEEGSLISVLPEDGRYRHVVLYARDHSGNYHSVSLYAGSELETPFGDMTGHWAEDYVAYLYAHGIVNGRPGGEGEVFFDPNTPMTRAEFAAMLCRWLNIGAEEGEAQVRFADEADIPAWALDYVHAAAARGLVQGVMTEAGLCFLPREPITRSQAATILGRNMEAGRMKGVLDFEDAEEVPAWAEGYLSELAFMGVMNGDGVRLDPKGNLTRAQCAKLLAEFT